VVDTRMTAENPRKKMAPADCAAQIVRGIESNKEEVFVGATKMLRVVSELSPATARRIMIRY